MSETLLRRLRMASLVVGSAALVAAMILFAEAPRPRDLAWTIGVAALVLVLVLNRLLRHAERGRRDDGPPAG